MARQIQMFVGRNPRLACAISLGFGATSLVYLSLVPGVGGLNGNLFAVAAGLTHALAGSITGRRIVYPNKLPKLPHAALRGAGTSLLALLFFSLGLAGKIYQPQFGDRHPVVLVFFTFSFAFLGAGWALVILSMGIGCGLCWFAPPQDSGIDEHRT